MYTRQHLIEIDRCVKIALTALAHRQPERARALLSNLDIDLSAMIESEESREQIEEFPKRPRADADTIRLRSF